MAFPLAALHDVNGVGELDHTLPERTGRGLQQSG